MTEDGWTKNQLIDAIKTATADHWSKRRLPLLLSELGMELTLKRGDYRSAIAPQKLRPFISAQLSSAVKIVTDPSKPQKIGLIPAGETYSFEPVVRENADPLPREAKERIKPTIWAAFVKPLASGWHRYIDTDDHALRFQDIPDVSPPTKTARPVPGDRIIDGQGKDYIPEEVAKRIKAWADENNLPKERLYNREMAKKAPQKNFFDLFNGLSDSDLRRIEIPFDIVMKLARQ